MADVVLGTGMIIIVTVSVVSVLLSLVLSRTDGPARFAGLGLIPVAAAISLILWFIPRELATNQQVVDVKKYDPNYFQRNVIISLMGITLAAGLFMYFVFDILEPIYAKPLKKLTY